MVCEDKVLQEAYDQIVSISKQRGEILNRMKEALVAGDHEKVLKYAGQLLGVEDEGCRISQGIDPRTGK